MAALLKALTHEFIAFVLCLAVTAYMDVAGQTQSPNGDHH